MKYFLTNFIEKKREKKRERESALSCDGRKFLRDEITHYFSKQRVYFNFFCYKANYTEFEYEIRNDNILFNEI